MTAANVRMPSRRPIEVVIPCTPPPVHFVTTAFRKSGSNWMEAMVFALPGVTGFGQSGDSILLTVTMLMRAPELIDALRAMRVPLSTVLSRLLNPSAAVGEPLPSSVRPAIEAAMMKVLARVPVRTGLLNAGELRRPPLARLVDPLFAPGAGPEAARARAIGCPSKHEAPSRLADQLPGYRIVQLVRDPRDVIVSRFYHDLAHVDRDMVKMFVRRDAAGRLEQRPDWMTVYFSARRDELLGYFADYGDALPAASPRLITRYEDLLVDTEAELGRIASFIGVGDCAGPGALRAIGERFSFAKVTEGDAAQVDPETGERRNSFLRKGKAGDWRTYFDRTVIGILGPRFTELLVELGYEDDDRWVESVPSLAPKAWDFSRLRVRQALARTFRHRWDASPALQERFPDPSDLLGADGGFLGHIVRSGDAEVLAHRATLIELARLWGSDVKETVYF